MLEQRLPIKNYETSRRYSRSAIAGLALLVVTGCSGSHTPTTRPLPPESVAVSDVPLPEGSDEPTFDKSEQLDQAHQFIAELNPEDLDDALIRVPDAITLDSIRKRAIHAANLKIAVDFVDKICDGLPYPSTGELNSIDVGDDDNHDSVADLSVKDAAKCLQAEAGEQFVSFGKHGNAKPQLAMLRRLNVATSLSLTSYIGHITALRKQAKHMGPNNLTADDYVGDRKAAYRSQANSASDSLASKASQALSQLEPENN
jgi:hypothetical protein